MLMPMTVVPIADMGMGVGNGLVQVGMGVPKRTVCWHTYCLTIRMLMGMVRVLIIWSV